MELKLTAAAEKFISRMVRFGGAGDNAGFRLSVSAGGCSGLASEFTVEAAALPGDAVVEVNTVKFFLPAESRLLLEGATIDFSESPTGGGLSFITATPSTCGSCGSSSSSASIDISGLGHGHGHSHTH
ncbi:MAG: iron-sulfur cluster biosynthesis family protein [Thiobacillus sp.]|uniref:HesB/IscA family protein n=1 Tax=Thiobacillus sp. TaxID=924 RepID=UPI0025FA586D|nr:iron-sulfur cluster biosynthesis family protein [Thiobacillus sp.]MBT9540041.1 iron-sulfur cluster assembly accessory protein [Thiobacillus sp.]MBU2642307.1 iron-sulfur cluster assembly accessory protein [Gammaproteobacteria bacterium]MDP1924911.1 iron-sulfur cluster biosynthesis family protein [Thiobacillus sp.]